MSGSVLYFLFYFGSVFVIFLSSYQVFPTFVSLTPVSRLSLLPSVFKLCSPTFMCQIVFVTVFQQIPRACSFPGVWRRLYLLTRVCLPIWRPSLVSMACLCTDLVFVLKRHQLFPHLSLLLWIQLSLILIEKVNPFMATALPDGSGVLWGTLRPSTPQKTKEQQEISSDKDCKWLSKPQNSPDPNSTGHAGAMPIHSGSTLQPTGNILVLSTMGSCPKLITGNYSSFIFCDWQWGILFGQLQRSFLYKDVWYVICIYGRLPYMHMTYEETPTPDGDCDF